MFLLSKAIRHLHIFHYNAPYLPQKILHNLCFYFISAGYYSRPKRNWNNAYAKFWGGKKMIFHSRPNKTEFALSLVLKVWVLDIAALWPILGQSWENGDKVPKPYCPMCGGFYGYFEKGCRLHIACIIYQNIRSHREKRRHISLDRQELEHRILYRRYTESLNSILQIYTREKERVLRSKRYLKGIKYCLFSKFYPFNFQA